MSTSIDSRIVTMKFDNEKFNRGAETTMGVLSRLKAALLFPANKGSLDAMSAGADRLKTSLGGVQTGVDGVSNKFLALATVGITTLSNITNRAVDAGISLGKSLTIDPIKAGFQEYEKGLTSVQTILANTGASGATLEDVNGALDELNHYADQTIYNFGEMARNIGTFTAAGVDLETATGSIKGIANLAALSGSTSEQASTAMYQLSQAISAGRVSLQDWNSVVNAGMGGSVFQRALAETAVAMGTVDEAALKLDGRMKNVKINGQSFRESIQARPGEQSWLTSDVLTNTLEQFTGDLSDAELAAQGFNAEQIKAIKMQATVAQDAATKVKTLTQLIDTIKESVGSGWAETWRYIFGDFEEAKMAFSRASQVIGFFVGRNADARNKILEDWKELGGRNYLVKGIGRMFQAVYRLIAPFTKAFRDIFPRTTGAQLTAITKGFYDFAGAIRINNETFVNLRRTFRGVFAAIHIVTTVVGAVVKGVIKSVLALIQLFFPFSGSVLGVTGSIGDMVVALDELLTGTLDIGGAIGKFFDALIYARAAVFGPIIAIISSLLDAVGFLLTEGFGGFQAALSDIPGLAAKAFGALGTSVLNTFGFLGTAVNFLLDRMGPLGDSIRNVGEGIGTVFGRGRDAVVKFLKSLGSFGKNLAQFLTFDKSDIEAGFKGLLKDAKPFFDFMAKVGEKTFVGLGKAAEFLGEVFSVAFSAVPGILTVVVGLFQTIATAIGSLFGGEGPDTSKVTQGVSDIGDKLEPAADAADKLGNFLKIVGGYVGPVLETIGEAFTEIGTTAATVLKYIALGLGAIVVGAAKAVAFIFTKITEIPGGFLEGISSGLEGGGDLLKRAFGDFTLQDILSLINTAFLIGIFRTYGKYLKAVQGFYESLTGVGESFAGTLDQATENLKAMQLDVKAGAILKIAAALLVLSVALLILSKIKAEDLAKGLAAIGALLAMLVKTITSLEALLTTRGAAAFGAVGVGFVLLATSLIIMAGAVKLFALMKTEDLAKGIGAISAVLLTMALLAKTTAGAGASMIAVAFAVGILSASLVAFLGTIAVFAAIDEKTLAKGLFVIAVSLQIIKNTIGKIGPGMLSASAGVLIVSFALLVLARALMKFGNMTGGQIIKSMIALGGALGILYLAMLGMNALRPAANAIVVVAAGLLVLAFAMRILGKMSLKEIGIALLALVGIFTVIGAAAFILAPLAPVIVALGGGLALLGIALLGMGIGMAFFAAGLATLAVSGAAGFAVLIAGIVAFLNILPLIATQFGLAIIAFAKVMSDAGPVFNEALTVLLLSALQAIIDVTPKLGEAITVLLAEGLRIIAEFVPDFAAAGYDLLLGLIEEFTKRVPEFAEKGANLAVALMRAFADEMPDLINEAFNALTKFMNDLADVIDARSEEFGAAGGNLMASIIQGMLKASKAAMMSFLDRFGLAGFASKVYNTIKDAITGAFSGSDGQYSPVIEAAVDQMLLDRRASETNGGSGPGQPSTGRGEGGTNQSPGSGGSGGNNYQPGDQPAERGFNNPAARQMVSPTITPVVDLSNVESSSRRMGEMLNQPSLTASRSFSEAAAVAEAERIARDAAANNPATKGEVKVEINQTNNSPVAIDPSTHYRNTKSAFALAKEGLEQT